MKQKGLLLLSFLFLLCSCTNDTTTTLPDTMKIDEDKAYLYVKDTYHIPFTEDQEAYVKEEDRMIDSYVININSESAKKASDELQRSAMTQIANIKKLDDGTIANVISLRGSAIESTSYITILIETQPFVEASELQINQLKTYIFDKNTKELITTEQMLKEQNLTNETIIKAVQEQYNAQGYTICGDMPGDCFYEPTIMKDDPYISDTVMYLDQENNLIVYIRKSIGLSYEWVPIVIPL